jgi:quinol monooxygenase YgiN
MEIDRRHFLLDVSAATFAVALVPMVLQGASGMYGLIVKLTIVPGRREGMIRILKESAADMPGCFSYVVAKDAADENVLWVTEVWDSEASHDASASLPAVKKAIPQGKELVTGFEKTAVTTPVWGVGLKAASSN